jgi:hypothetical protein
MRKTKKVRLIMKPFIATLISLLFLWEIEAIAQQYKTYYTRDNKNARNISISVDYPAEYELELDAGNLLKAYFIHFDLNASIAKILQIMVPPDPPFGDPYRDFCSFEDSEIDRIVSKVPRKEGMTIYPGGEKKVVNGICGFSAKASIKFSQQGVPLYTELDRIVFGYINKTVNSPRYFILTCNTTGIMEDMNKVKAEHQKDASGLCARYFDSLKVYDQR